MRFSIKYMRTLDLFEIWQCIQHILPADNNSISYGCLHFSLKDLVVNCLKLCQAVTGWAGIFHLKEKGNMNSSFPIC